MRSSNGAGVPLYSGADVEGLGLMRLADDRALQLVLAALERTPQARVVLGISADTVSDGTWLAKASAALVGRTELSRRMIVEIPNAALGQSGEAASRLVGTLGDLGCAVAVGDFGAGIASLRVLNHLGVHYVRIEGSLVESPRDRTLVRGLIDLARALGMKTIAAGVATEASAGLLADWGADYLQGSWIGEAVVGDPPPIEQDA
jgi:EAL domain-containing protein (putative c-di-GMP-specific phosphodiesterase class I)